ncbi:hypothetical protein COL922a_009925 [Colletotrichum nupharicola]|nr:hypothetical protein COL922a_009925 [Colletotrichum nupharicola]
MAVGAAIPPIEPKSINFAIDRGGTFTDVWASIPGQPDVVLKLLSVDPGNYDDAPAEGIRRVLEMVSGTTIPRRSPIPKDLIHSICMGTTVATNDQNFFDLGIRKPELLYDEVIEISERLTVEAYDEDVYKTARTQPKESPGLFVKGITGDI